MNLSNVESLAYSVPELILAGAVVGLLMLELVVRRKAVLGELALVVTAADVLTSAWQAGGPQGWLLNRMVVLDSFAIFFKIMLGLAAFGAVWLSIGSKELKNQHPG